MRDKLLLTPDPVTNSNLIDTLLDKLFPNSPGTKSFLKWLIRLLGYGVLTWFGIDVVS